MKNDKAVVLLSGGLDSATCLAKMVKENGCANTIALNAYYGQKHSKEIECARKLAEFYHVEYHEIDLKEIFTFSDCSLLSSSAREIPDLPYSEQSRDENGYVSTYVPFRNGVLLSIASALALSLGFDKVVCGVHQDDASGEAYPDCSVSFVENMNKAIMTGTNNCVGVLAPFVNLTKKDIVAEGLKLHVPYELTWSCYEGGETPCGKCGTCRDRMKAFALNGIIDPLMK